MVKINIAFAVNDAYVQHLNVTIYSILRNNPKSEFTFYILCESLTSQSKKKIQDFKQFFSNVDIKIIELKDKGYGFNKFAIPEGVNFITKEMYFRYALPEVVQDVDKILYLDADLIALGDISGFYKENIDDYYMAGAVDAGIVPRYPEHLPSLGMSNTDIYVNSGVLLMNLLKMRDNGITKKLLDNTGKYEKQLLFPDQDVLNLTLKGYVKPVKCVYNFTDQNMLENKVNIDDVKIVHFTGGIKPWHHFPQVHTKKYVDRYRQYEDEYYSVVAKELNALISIIIPVYNISEDYLRECFESVKKQSYENVEVIVVDDGSSKNTANFIDVYCKNLKNWKVIHQKNAGVNMARKAGFEASKGKFVTFVDSDDALVDTFCEQLLKSAIKTDADIVIAEKHNFNSDVSSLPVGKDKRPEDVLSDKADIIKAHRITPFAMDSWGVTIWGALYERRIIQGVDWEFSDYTIAEDEFWTVQTKVLANKIVYVHEQLYCYRMNLASRSRVIEPSYFKGNGENRKVPFVSSGLEIFHKNTALFEKHKISMPEEPLLYGISVTKRVIGQCYDAGKLDMENTELAKSIAGEFLSTIESKKLVIDKAIMFDLEMIKASPEIFIHYTRKLEENQAEISRLTGENLLRDAELELLRRPGIKFAVRKLAGAIKRRLLRGFTGRVVRKILGDSSRPSVEMFDQRYSAFKGIKALRPTAKTKGRYIVTLTSYGDRIKSTAPRAIYSILSGKTMPDKVVLWLADGEQVPEELKRMEEYGLEIKFTKDIRSYKKLIPALREFPNDILVTADDDVYYPKDWLSELKKAHRQNPKKIVANRGDVIVYDQNGKIKPYGSFVHGGADGKTENFIPTGAGGVLYPPRSLNERVVNEVEFMKLSNNNDDIWFWAMALLNDTEFVLTKNLYGNVSVNPLVGIHADAKESALWESNSPEGGDQSATALRNVLEQWPEIKERVADGK